MNGENADTSKPEPSRPRLVAFLFTDLVDSTGIKGRIGVDESLSHIRQPHDRMVQDLIQQFPGCREQDNAGDGFFLTFESAAEAAKFALLLQHQMSAFPWERERALTRIGIHIGDAREFYDASGNRKVTSKAQDLAARVMSLAGGGQILLTKAAFESARQFVLEMLTVKTCERNFESVQSLELIWQSHGHFQLKGHEDLVEVCEVGFVGIPTIPPQDSEKARRAITAGPMPITTVRSQYEAVQHARYDPFLAQFLQRYYSAELLSRGGITYPVYCLAAGDQQAQDFESILGSLNPIEQDRLTYSASDDGYRLILQQLGKKIYNGRMFVMDRVLTEGRLRIDCSLGWYYDALATCDALEWELLSAIVQCVHSADPYEQVANRLRLRQKSTASNNQPWIDGSQRCAALSIAVLVVFFDGHSRRALIRQRSGATAAHSDLYHVVPSFMMEYPWAEDALDEFSVFHQVLREYLEELCGAAEVDHAAGQLSHTWFYELPQALRLRSLLDSNSARLSFTGYAVNLLNLRPEICMLLEITDPAWHRGSDIKCNWEFLTPDEAHENRHPGFLTVPIHHDDAEVAATLNKLPGTFVPPGAAAFWLGMDRARKSLASS